MNRIFCRSLPIALAALLASTSGYCESNLDGRIGKLETNMKKVRAETAYGNYGAKTASANPQLDGYGFFATADFLWWKLYEGGTDYLFKSKNDSGVFPIKGNIKHLNFDWEPGFKIGAGYVFEHDSWDADLEFTYFRTHARHSSNSSFAHLFPLVGVEKLELTNAKGHWNVNFYDIDLVLGRNYFVSKFLALRPFFGLTSAWIEQHRHFRFITNTDDRISLKSKNDFWGIGPRLGLDAQFFLSERISVYGNVAGNLLWGDFHVEESESNQTTALQFYKMHDHFHKMTPSVAFGLGMSYETNFYHDLYHFAMKVGYENQYWWRQNQLPIFDIDAQQFRKVSEDLSMQGLTVEFRLDF